MAPFPRRLSPGGGRSGRPRTARSSSGHTEAMSSCGRPVALRPSSSACDSEPGSRSRMGGSLCPRARDRSPWRTSRGRAAGRGVRSVRDLPRQTDADVDGGRHRRRLGRRGGYMLAKPTTRITVRDIVDAVDGPKPLFWCTEIRRRGPFPPPNEHCADVAEWRPRSTGPSRPGETSWRPQPSPTSPSQTPHRALPQRGLTRQPRQTRSRRQPPHHSAQEARRPLSP